MQKHIILASTLLLAIFLSGCLGGEVTGGTTYQMEKQAKTGDSVTVAYVLTVDGAQIDAGNAFNFKLGAGGVIPGFDKAVTGMSIGETKSVTLSGEDAYTSGQLAGKTLNFKITLLRIN